MFFDIILTIWTALQSTFSGVLLRFRLLRDIFGEEFVRPYFLLLTLGHTKHDLAV